MIHVKHMIFLSSSEKCFVTDNLSGCDGSCSDPMKWCRGKVDLRIAIWLRVCEKPSEESLACEDVPIEREVI